MSVLSRKIFAWAVVFSLLLLPAALAAREKRGARLRIVMADFRVVEGELLKVSGETLVLFNDQSQQGIQMGLSEVRSLGVRRKRNVLVGMGTGFFVGLISAACLVKIGGSEDDEVYLASLFWLIVTVPTGMLVGGLISGLRKPYREMIVGGFPDKDRDAILAELKSLSREALNDASGE